MSSLHRALWGASLLMVSACADRAWPVDDPDRNLWHSYGQLQESATAPGFRYLHEGIDIPAPAFTTVRFHGYGIIAAVDDQDPSVYQRSVQIREGTRTWIYRHIDPARGLRNASVRPGMVIGTIAPAPQGVIHLDDHLHVGLIIGGQLDDPLLYLRERTTKAAPPAPEDVLLLARPGNRRFTTTVCSSPAIVVRGPTDIVAKTMDGFPAYRPSVTGVHMIGFEVMQGSQFLIDEISFLFARGRRSVVQTERDAASRLVPVIFSFEPDPAARSRDVDRRPVMSQSTHVSFYVLTNIGDNRSVIAPADESRSWNTAVVQGTATSWNKNGPLAAANIAAHSPDGPYTAVAWVLDENRRRSDRSQRIFVNNFDETLDVGNAEGVPAQQFGPGEPVYVFGSGYPPGRRFSVFQVPAPGPANCAGLIAHRQLVVRSDASGRIPPTLFPGVQAGQFVMVLDYDGDVIYTSPRETHVVDPVSPTFTSAGPG